MDDILKYEHPFVCTDAVVFTLKTKESDSYRKLPDTSMKILLYSRTEDPFEGKWCLPGGFLNIDELPEDNIRRKLFAKTDVGNCWLEQLYTFCATDRDPRARVLSISYLGLLNEAESQNFKDTSIWFTIKHDKRQRMSFQNGESVLHESDLGFDHYAIIRAALERLRSKILYTNIIFELMPKEFTLTQLQNAYETILGRKDQAANFRRKIMGLVQETSRSTSNKGHRPAKLYTKKRGKCEK